MKRRNKSRAVFLSEIKITFFNDAVAEETQYWSRDPNFLVETQCRPPRISDRVYAEGSISRKGRVKERDGRRAASRRCLSDDMDTLRIEQFWIVDVSRISPSILEPLVPRDRFEMNQRFRVAGLLSLRLSLSFPTHAKDPQLPARFAHCPIFNQKQ